jgi:hypothetical protein
MDSFQNNTVTSSSSSSSNNNTLPVTFVENENINTETITTTTITTLESTSTDQQNTLKLPISFQADLNNELNSHSNSNNNNITSIENDSKLDQEVEHMIIDNLNLEQQSTTTIKSNELTELSNLTSNPDKSQQLIEQTPPTDAKNVIQSSIELKSEDSHSLTSMSAVVQDQQTLMQARQQVTILLSFLFNKIIFILGIQLRNNHYSFQIALQWSVQVEIH